MKANATRSFPMISRIPHSHKFKVNGIYKGRHIEKYSFATAEDAEAWLEKRKADIDEEVKPSKFQDLCDQFLALYETEYKRSSYWQTALFVRHSIEPKFKGKKVSDAFSAESLSAFRDGLVKSGNTSGHNNRAISLMRRIAEFGMERDLVPMECWKTSRVYLKDFRDDTPKTVYRIWSQDQFRQFMATFDDADPKQVIFEVLFTTGMRIGEALGLKASDFDSEKNALTIARTATSKVGMGKTITQAPKTAAGNRTVLLSPEVGADVKAIISIYCSSPDRFVFWGNDTPYSLSDVRRIFEIHSKKAGLPRIKIHEIRHSYNSWLLDKYHTPEDVAAITKRLGRSSIKVTLDTYYHAQADRETKLVDFIKLKK